MLSRSSFGGTLVRRLAIAMFCVTNASIWAQSQPAGRSRDANKQIDRADKRIRSHPTLQADSSAGWWLTAESQAGTLIWQNPLAQVDDDGLDLLPVGSVRPPGADGWPMSSDVGEEGFGALPAGFWYDREKEGLYAFIGGYSLGDALDDLEAYFDADVDQLIATQPLFLEVLREYGTIPRGGGWTEAGDEFLEEIFGQDGASLLKEEASCIPPPIGTGAKSTEKTLDLIELSDILGELLRTLLATKCAGGRPPRPCPCCQSPDPCCGVSNRCCNEDNPCCGSPDPCCNPSDACCENPDRCCNEDNPCCESSDPCCNAADTCCGNPDPCCNTDNPCCEDPDPCCGNPDPCCPDPDPCCGNPDPCCPITEPCDPECGDPCLCLNCDDEDPCTIDSCVSSGGCQNDPLCTDPQVCCGDATCCDPARCCGNGQCCTEACEACYDNGTLSGGSVTVNPGLVCIGDIITFMVSGEVDEGGIWREYCTSKTAIPAVTPTYTWVITKPDASTVNGTGSVATVVADEPGGYSCTFTASADRECPPADHIIEPGSITLVFEATLTLDPSFIPAKTDWPSMPNYSLTEITVEWDPPECEGRLEIVEIDNQGNGYLPPNNGTLTPINASLWRYDAFDEPTHELCAKPVRVWIGAMQGDEELDRVSILVYPVHAWWTLPAHIHGPGEQQHLRDNADFMNDYNFLRFKYAAVLATTQGGFNGPPTISTATCVPCPRFPGDPWPPCVYACVTDGSVVFGTDTFTASENQAASIIGHELLHTTGADECPAYRWEAEHCDGTGVCPCDGGEDEYLGTVRRYLIDNNCP